MTSLVTSNGHGPFPDAVEKTLIGGDLSNLTVDERLAFYYSRCEAAQLDPRTQPFQYLNLSGKLTLYATKSATDQLIAAHKLTVEITDRSYDEGIGCYIVQCRVKFPDGHTVEDIGVLHIANLRGESLANAVMKCVTKAKRRTVLSACGLGMLDETEVETIPGATVIRVEETRPVPVQGTPQPRVIASKPTPYSEPIAKAGSFREWLEGECQRVSDHWRNTCLIENKEPKKTPGTQQVGNHLIKLWISQDALEEEHITTDGKRDKVKVAAALNGAWTSEDQDEVKEEVTSYLKAEIDKLAEEAGITLVEDVPTETP